MPVRNNKQSGFTLVEMSIVLVIIGLIVAGVLVGQDLVKNAQVRATVQQIQGYDAAVNAFRGKFDCMPGDCTKQATYLTLSADAAAGNGNGRLDDVVATPVTGVVTTGFAGELKYFREVLAKADMVNGQFVSASTSADSAVGTHIPATKLKKGTVVAGSEGADNYWVVGALTTVPRGSTTWLGAGGYIQPVEAFGIDTKIDDGMADTGLVKVITGVGAGTNGFTAPTGAATAGTHCWVGTIAAATPADYPLTQEGNLCAIKVKFQS